MSNLIEATLREVLVDDGRVALPGLGTLIRENHAAVLSGADRQIIPPSARVVFNDNLIVNDGRLLRTLVEKKGLLRPAAETSMDEYVAAVSSKLDKGQSVELTGVGRLFKQFDGKITFASTGEGLSKHNFGLPRVAFNPINRRDRDASADPLVATNFSAVDQTIAVPPTPPPGPASWRERLPKEGWYVIMGALVLLVLWALLRLFGAVGGAVVENPRRPVTKPDGVRTEAPVVRTVPRKPATTSTPARDVAPAPAPRLNAARRNQSSVTATPAVSSADLSRSETSSTPPLSNSGAAAGAGEIEKSNVPADGVNVALIATGLFGNQSNVEKNVLRIEQAGFKPFTRPAGRYTRIGVETSYRTLAERDGVLARVREQFATEAFVMYVNGERIK
ncbi:HU domain-containing protein [Neolewinella antarctica]|uniref:CCDC81-like prokaryotic HU domain-containing protein n=1 Tax=Neolewinella antarctica TaxID=442734 RepID=A0ABX0X797_9BACT|nr:hypothetical protein [Neolewinella antarctica]NJC24859.1 hypothetical protein [Neolewinella antarctica]